MRRNTPLPVPKHLLRGLPEVDHAEIEEWWNSLPEPTKEQVATLCDRRHESCIFGVLGPNEAPEVTRGHFLPDADDSGEPTSWNQDHFDYLMNYPELVVVWDPIDRRVRVGCVAHADARECWAAARIPEKFQCPFDRTDCLMNPMKGRSVSLYSASNSGHQLP